MAELESEMARDRTHARTHAHTHTQVADLESKFERDRDVVKQLQVCVHETDRQVGRRAGRQTYRA